MHLLGTIQGKMNRNKQSSNIRWHILYFSTLHFRKVAERKNAPKSGFQNQMLVLEIRLTWSLNNQIYD